MVKAGTMRWAFAILLGMVCACAVAQTTKQNTAQSKTVKTLPAGNLTLDKLIADPSAWRSVDWSKPGVLDDPKWSSIAESEVDKNGYVMTHDRNTPGFSLPAMKRLRRQEATSGSDVMLSLSAEVPSDSCVNLATAIGKDLGQTIFSEETSRIYFSETSSMDIVVREWQWTIGGTRVGANCIGFVSTAEKKKDISFAVTFEPVSRRAELKPAFLLRCTRTLRLSSGREPSDIGDFVFWVKEGPAATVRDSRFVIVSVKDSALVNDQQISFTIKNSETMSTRYMADRVTGQLRGDVTEKDKPIGKVSGTCSKADSLTKF